MNMKRFDSVRLISWLVLMSITLMFAGCETQQQKKGVNEKWKIVTTTGMIEDAVSSIVGDAAEVTALMGPGVDPHLYKATQGDLEKLTNADIIFYNGLHLEGKMGEVLEKLARTKPVIAVGERIDKRKLRAVEGFGGTYDPHIWFDVSLWQDAVRSISAFMQDQDSARATYYKGRTSSYLQQLDSLHADVKKSISTIPKEQRVLITAHDAFGYFGDAYDIEVQGLQGISTLSEFGLRDVTQLVNFIIERKIRSIYVETSVSEKSIEAVVAGCQEKKWNVAIGGNLYSDAMGTRGTPEGSYIGMVRANVQKIVNGLK